jgi:ABC-type branched-subunit amino acid transport system ATPase component
MKLTLSKPFMSIVELPDVELPRFTLLTGINGVGKTHLLRAIEKNHVFVDGRAMSKNEVRFLDWTNLRPNNAEAVPANAGVGVGEVITKQLEDLRRDYQAKLWSIEVIGLSPPHGDRWNYFRLTREQVAAQVEPQDPTGVWNGIESVVDDFANQLRTRRDHAQRSAEHNNAYQNAVDGLIARHGKRALPFLTADEIESAGFIMVHSDMFHQSFAPAFQGYFDLQKSNRLLRLDEQEGRAAAHPSLSDQQFEERHGRPPWDIVNEALTTMRLDFEIDYPRFYLQPSFMPRLRKRSSGVEVGFHELSSGEKILISFAICLYHAIDERNVVAKPRLLLLDEVDAPLHPSMARSLVDVLQSFVVERMGVGVILVTHSPSTVAVAPEDSVHVMLANRPGIHRAGRRQAIATLTSELPTLSIDFGGQRQVFVESELDARRFDALYRLLAASFESERSLVFIGAGRRGSKGDEGGGREAVRTLVSSLARGGNHTVFGLVDWDRANVSSERVHVLAEGSRYGIENCLLDPLLLLALLVNEGKSRDRLGLQESETYTSLGNRGVDRLQALVDVVQREVLGGDSSESIEVAYEGGLKLRVRCEYLVMQCHELEERVKRAFHEIQRFQNQGALLIRIVESVVRDHPEFLPIEIPDAFRAILRAEVDVT